ncbi:endonuclease/exonuclease/phosphatase family protein [Nocardiopsis sp. HNM0947]|uniref:Endonuclease/exonuclease/phosphatase family protein n=1 Tax=Nocardiopsis coralli TaxID=2772213 RepID=A0ABR9P0J1_9ACTN|nr:endonuclease/exonuclease/phosphatase family protein [Nocardiopsis coralli]MBE2997329.1 endonuclease/exonuclease/phosphatase family protein [Nocardiopsis coralli]
MHPRSGGSAATLVLASAGVRSAPSRAAPSSVPPPPPEGTVRFATFNAALSRPEPGALLADLAAPGNRQVRNVAEIVQRVRPDVLLVNEFDHDPHRLGPRLFQDHHLARGVRGARGIDYPYVYTGPVNTGVASGADLDGNGKVVTRPGTLEHAGDAFGFGLFPGQYGMVVFSRLPLLTDRVRTFRRFRWVDLPGAMLPNDPVTGRPFHDAAAREVMRLSSKAHWDIPVEAGGRRPVHLLASHPTPPAFDGPERRNVLRNHDEIRFWVDYLSGSAGHIYDDVGGRGGLPPRAPFVVAGDLNADPDAGAGHPKAIRQLLEHPSVQDPVPSSRGGLGAAALDPSAPEPEGHLRADYVLPSDDLRVRGSGVFWPAADDPLYRLTGDRPFPSSDHRLVWVDVDVRG